MCKTLVVMLSLLVVFVKPLLAEATVSTWKSYGNFAKGAYVSGFYTGEGLAAFLLTRDNASLKERKKKKFLLMGWEMSPSDFVAEVNVQLEKKPVYVKSISASFVRAEAKFASAAGQDTRAKRLREEADAIERMLANAGEDAAESDNPVEWHHLVGMHIVNEFTQGVLDGILMRRREVDDGTAKMMQFRFPAEQLVNEMNKIAPSSDDTEPLLSLMRAANINLARKAAGK